ncbi:MAG: diguanylate cyclase [Candidatus Levybacteria bacterium]|nr:diguanylate cyclase [Candidatus Levybacteria bacterium]
MPNSPDTQRPEIKPRARQIARRDALPLSQPEALPPRPEVTDEEFLNVAEVAILAAKQEHPDTFREAEEGFERVQRVSRRQVARRKWTRARADQFEREAFAAYVAADSYDEVTGALDRGSFVRSVSRGITKHPHPKKTHVYMDTDINKLKDMNEKSKNKHASADRALATYAKFHIMKLSEHFGYRGRMGRLSGDEFGIIIEDTTPEEVETFFTNIAEERAAYFGVVEQEEELVNPISATMAMTTFEPGDTFDSMHRRTDAELVALKQARNNIAQQTTQENG